MYLQHPVLGNGRGHCVLSRVDGKQACKLRPADLRDKRVYEHHGLPTTTAASLRGLLQWAKDLRRRQLLPRVQGELRRSEPDPRIRRVLADCAGRTRLRQCRYVSARCRRTQGENAHVWRTVLRCAAFCAPSPYTLVILKLTGDHFAPSTRGSSTKRSSTRSSGHAKRCGQSRV